MHIGLGDDAEFARKFDREARSAAKLSHPNVVSVFDQGHDDGRPYIVMEYVEGRTLRDILNHEAPLPPDRALEIIEPVLGALAAAHEGGLVHRDVKPENVLLSDRGQIKVVDFGLAKAISAQTSTATQGLLIGTVSYLPPELVLSGRAGPRADVYSAGVVLFEMLTGRKPHVGDTPIQVAYAHVHNDVPPPSQFSTAGHIPPYLDALVTGATARNPDARPHDGKVFLSEVRRVRAALRDGLSDDPELTQDLSVLQRSDLSAAMPPGVDPDSEITQLRAAARLRAGRSAADRPPARSDADLAAHLPRRATAHRARPHDGRDGPQPRVLRRRRAAGVPTRARGFASPARLVDRAAGADAHRHRRVGRVVPDRGSLHRHPGPDRPAADRGGHRRPAGGSAVPLRGRVLRDGAPGFVIDTEPIAGTRCRTAARSPPSCRRARNSTRCPRSSGSARRRDRAIKDANLTLGSVSQAFHPKVAKGVVTSASYTPGTKPEVRLDRRSDRVQGPQPIKITDHTGKSAAAAKAALTKAGFKVKITTANSDSVNKGMVISQSPDQGTG